MITFDNAQVLLDNEDIGYLTYDNHKHVWQLHNFYDKNGYSYERDVIDYFTTLEETKNTIKQEYEAFKY